MDYTFNKKMDVNKVLDPFSGIGTTITRSYEKGLSTTGIEILPVANAVAKARLSSYKADKKLFIKNLNKLESCNLSNPSGKYNFQHIRITKGAFSKKTETELSAYNDFLEKIEDETTRYLFWFASLAILEKISYTRKDGQYLRWDHRARRKVRSSFEKSKVYQFKPALLNKLKELLDDINNHSSNKIENNRVNIIEGSSLKDMFQLQENTFDVIITSPPYCNRYDYTRTYALELAYMGYNDEDVKLLRQKLLSATVENKSKYDELYNIYKKENKIDEFQQVNEVFSKNSLLNNALSYLKKKNENKELNNKNIISMVHNYFFEMAFIIKNMSKSIAPNGRIFMVNDNVQYAGYSIPVDFILSNFASEFGLSIEKIWVLPNGKGNSSQQMGKHGRNEIRKCVYVWHNKE
ncbi:MAG: restriction endonuclease [Candidatus Marinimicrobia bacterium]|nr:restriction endonuclease [Candidatus Neomarinimicrobiota bacterium]